MKNQTNSDKKVKTSERSSSSNRRNYRPKQDKNSTQDRDKSGTSNYKRRPSRGKRYSRNSNRYQNMSIGEIFKQYDKLLETHNAARKKYFETYYKIKPGQNSKLKNSYHSSLLQLRKLESSLSPSQRRVFHSRYGSKIDTTYSESNELNPRGEVTQATRQDIHLLPSQIEFKTTYQSDTTESSGTIDDYLKLKKNI